MKNPLNKHTFLVDLVLKVVGMVSYVIHSKVLGKENREFTLHLSKKLINQFVQLTRKESLHWEKKHGDATFHS